MLRIHAFRPEGPTVKLTAAITTSNVQVHPGTSKHVRVYNKGAVEVYVAFSNTNAITAAIPVVGTPASGSPVPAGAVEIFTNVGGWAAAITPSGTADLFFTPGEGM